MMTQILNSPATIGVVDDHPFIGKGIEAMAALDDGLTFSWACDSAAAALRLLASDAPEVLVVDMKMGSGSEGLELLRETRIRFPDTKVIVLSAFASKRLVNEAARLGASGYFVKTQGVLEVLDAAKSLPFQRTGGFLGPFGDWAKPAPFLDLSVREVEVLVEIARGSTNQQAARALGIKVGTVKTHIESIFRKLGVRSRAEALRVALAENYFFVEELSQPAEAI